jgi:arsenate reductase
MAEALARHLAADVIEASSAGLCPLGKIAALTSAVLAEEGIAIDRQRSKRLHEVENSPAELVINLSGRPIENYFDSEEPNIEDWNVPDPYGRPLAAYRQSREEIRRRVIELADRLRAAQKASH